MSMNVIIMMTFSITHLWQKKKKTGAKNMSARLETLIRSAIIIGMGVDMLQGQVRFWLLRLKSCVLEEADL